MNPILLRTYFQTPPPRLRSPAARCPCAGWLQQRADKGPTRSRACCSAPITVSQQDALGQEEKALRKPRAQEDFQPPRAAAHCAEQSR